MKTYIVQFPFLGLGHYLCLSWCEFDGEELSRRLDVSLGYRQRECRRRRERESECRLELHLCLSQLQISKSMNPQNISSLLTSYILPLYHPDNRPILQSLTPPTNPTTSTHDSLHPQVHSTQTPDHISIRQATRHTQ